jgi:predicted AlkP superfamily phosphohydrolase/phosphomutase
MNPAKIGVFGFSQRIPGTYDYTFANLTHCRAPTIWHWLNRHGVKTAVVHVPGTFPPHEIDGVLVSGWPAPLNRGNLVYTHPEALSREIDMRLGQPFEFASQKPLRTDNDAEMLQERLRLTRMQGDVAHWTLSENEWDAAVVVFTATDQAAHQFWRHMDPRHPSHDPEAALLFGDSLLRVYGSADEEVGRLLSLLDEGDTVFVVSDHGFGPTDRTFYLNEWLRQKGYLVLEDEDGDGRVAWHSRLLGHLAGPIFRLNQKSPVFRRLAKPFKRRSLSNLLRDEYVRVKEQGLVRLNHVAVDWNRTRAYSPDEASLYLNLRGRDPKGSVEPGAEANRLLNEIVDGLLRVPDPVSGEPVPATPLRKESIYCGPFLPEAPDLVLAMDNYRTEVMAEIGSGSLFNLSPIRSGTHTSEGLFIAAGPGIAAGPVPGAGLMDIAPTVAHMMGVPVPREADGKVLLGLFEERAEPSGRPVVEESLGPKGQSAGGVAYTEEETEQVERQLRGMGYLS